jgi:hypothetical protein
MTAKEAHIQLHDPEVLYPDKPGQCVTQDITWSGAKVKGVATRFHSPDGTGGGSHLKANIHVDDDIDIDTFLTSGMIALRFNKECNLWFPKSRAVEIATAILLEASQPQDTKDRKGDDE